MKSFDTHPTSCPAVLPALARQGSATAFAGRACALVMTAALLGGCASSPTGGGGGSAGYGDLIDSGEVELVQITPQLVQAERAVIDAPISPELLGYRPESYRISPGDSILVAVWDHPELTASEGGEDGRLVHPDGTLYFPYVGTIKVAGMRMEELRGVLTGKLARYLRNPQVDVSLVGFGSRVTLQGAFVNTSPQDVTTVPLTLSQAVGTAVINVAQADLSGLVLTRDGKSHRINLDALSQGGEAAPEIYLKPGDRLYLPFNDRQEVYVLGEVLSPQAITFKTSDMTLTQALGKAGGLNPVTAKSEAVYVIRGIDEKTRRPAKVYQLNAKSPSAFALADQFAVQPGDVVYVGAGGVTRWSRFLSQLLPLSGIVRNAVAVPGN